MKKIDNRFHLSITDVKRIAAHTRALAREAAKNYSGSVEAWFDPGTGSVRYLEHVGSGYAASDDCELIAWANF